MKIRDTGPQRKHVGLKLATRRAARNGFKVLHEGELVGEVTSGSFTPTVDASIAMALVKTDLAEIGTQLQVDTGRDKLEAEIVKLPFYRRSK